MTNKYKNNTDPRHHISFTLNLVRDAIGHLTTDELRTLVTITTEAYNNRKINEFNPEK